MLKTIDIPVSVGYKSPQVSRRLSAQEVMNAIAGKFVHMRQYEQWVVENNMQAQGFPLKPRYMSGYPQSTDAILGNPPGTYKNWQKDDLANRQPWKQIDWNAPRKPRKTKAQKAITVKETRPVAETKPVVKPVVKQSSDLNDNILLDVIKVLEAKYQVPMEYLFLIKDTANINKDSAVEITNFLIDRMTSKIKNSIKV